MLALRETANTPDAAAGRQSFMRSLTRPDKVGFKKSFLAGVQDVIVRTPAGIHLGKRGGYNVDFGRLDRVMSRVIRGLYFHHFGVRMPPDAEVVSVSEEGLTDLDMVGRQSLLNLLAPLKSAAERRVGDGPTFRYRFTTASDLEFSTVWLLTIYDSTSFMGITLPRAEADEALALQNASQQ